MAGMMWLTMVKSIAYSSLTIENLVVKISNLVTCRWIENEWSEDLMIATVDVGEMNGNSHHCNSSDGATRGRKD